MATRFSSTVFWADVKVTRGNIGHASGSLEPIKTNDDGLNGGVD